MVAVGSMVYTLERGRMAAMVRLLTAGTFPDKSTEEASHEKVAVQTLNRDFHDADEANLLEEEDMHVFDSSPLTDPLHLVSCNTCKKPVKASQYAAHAERCRYFCSSEDISLELDGGAGHKKPPRNGRKKLQATRDNQGTTVGDHDKSESMDGDDAGGSESNFDDHSGMLSSLSRVAKRTTTSLDHTTVKNSSGISAGGTDYSTVAPVPLATKIYHSQGNHRLRIALGHLYREASAKEQGIDFVCPELLQDKAMLSSQLSPPIKLLNGAHQDNVSQTKKDTYPVNVIGSPDQLLAQSSDICLGTSGGFSSAISFSSEFRLNNFSRPDLPVDTAPVGVMRTRYHSAPYSYSGNSGTALGTMQQPNGSVPVV